MESLDQPQGASIFDWRLELGLKRDTFKMEWKPDLLGGIETLSHRAKRSSRPDSDAPLYENLSAQSSPPARSGEVTLIPYYTFHNREITAMQVWIPYRQTR